jgi:hypothetical protein
LKFQDQYNLAHNYIVIDIKINKERIKSLLKIFYSEILHLTNKTPTDKKTNQNIKSPGEKIVNTLKTLIFSWRKKSNTDKI